MYHAMIVVLH